MIESELGIYSYVYLSTFTENNISSDQLVTQDG